MLTNLGKLLRYNPGAFGKMLSRVDGRWYRCDDVLTAATLDAAAEHARGRRETFEALDTWVSSRKVDLQCSVDQGDRLAGMFAAFMRVGAWIGDQIEHLRAAQSDGEDKDHARR